MAVLFKRLSLVVSVLLMTVSSALVANSHPSHSHLAKYVAGTHYELLDNPVKLAADDKIEVMEVFWYGCGHCYSFEPYVQKWKETMADDVAFMRTPAAWADPMSEHAALYYTVTALDLPAEIHSDLFILLTKERRLKDVDRFAAVFEAHGIDKETFEKTYNSFGVKSKVKQATARVQKHYRTKGTPEIIVNGRYRVSGSMAGGAQGILDVVDFLIDLERG